MAGSCAGRGVLASLLTAISRFDALRLRFDKPFDGLRVVSVVEPLNALSLSKGIPQLRDSTVGAGVEIACLVEVGERVTRFRFDSFGDVAR